MQIKHSLTCDYLNWDIKINWMIEIDLHSASALATNNINLDVWFHVRYTGEKEQFYVTKASNWFGFKIVLHGWTIRAFLKMSSTFATVWPIEWNGMHFNFIVWCIYGITNVKETEQLGRVLLERFCREQIWTALLRIHVPIFIFLSLFKCQHFIWF